MHVGGYLFCPTYTKKSAIWLPKQGIQATFEKTSSSCSKNA